FESALARAVDERAKFLDQACGDDAALRREVESLLAHQQPTGRLIPTLINEAARLLPDHKPYASARFIPGTVLANRYRIIALLGKGGMGEVYRADDLKLAQSVALKFLPEKLSNDRATLDRFHREVRIARQISHPNVCRVFDIGEVENQHFLSMEYIDGEDLATLLRRIGRLPADKAVEIASQLCAGLSAAHTEGVLHRDLKPANVMIDGRGRAKITDFGLAGLADEFEGNEVRSGTPAYMAPEQLAGKSVSTRSDIYSLGLVLYEIFTGKKVFEAASLEDLMRQHETSAPPSISDHVREVDPLVERVIRRCLEREPHDRPSSVAQIAAALPGGDPLAAAIAAGETPSPEMVAAAPREGALNPLVALACLGGTILLLVLFVMASGRYAIQNIIPSSKSPEVLADRASSIIRKLGYTEPPVDSAYGFDLDSEHSQYLEAQDSFSKVVAGLSSGQPALIYFWYRESPRYLETLSHQNVTLADPPLQITNMASVRLDTQGRLIEFEAVPPQVDQRVGAASVDWSLLFSEAGLEFAKFTPAESLWVPPVSYDARAAWEGRFADGENPLRVEAAAFGGRPVYFQVIAPWQKPLRQEESATVSAQRAASILLAITFFAGVIAAVLLARNNVKLGRGDRKGAFKIARFIFTIVAIGLLIGADHVPTLEGELYVVYQAVAWALTVAVLIWVIYVALEPYVRRRWPRLIISWSRLLTGDFRDPMVGRDILVGGLLGLSHTLVIYSLNILPVWFGSSAPILIGDAPASHGLQSAIVWLLSHVLGHSLALGLGYLFLILLFYALLKKQWLAACALWLLQFSISALAFVYSSPWYTWVGVALIATIYAVAAVRYGLLALISVQFFFIMSFHVPLTTDLSSWRGGPTLLSLIALTGLALYGFYISRAGQTLFRARILKD
ncbi:MAG TPA: serine/threonine-protein kinase, partial [Blastocatellia bacterium]